MSLFSGLTAKLGALGLLLILLASGATYIHHKGAASQKAKDAKVILVLNGEIAQYQYQAEQDATAFLKLNQAAEAAKADAALQKVYADAALQQFHAEQQQQADAEAKRAAIVAKAEKTPACDTKLSVKLCPDLLKDY